MALDSINKDYSKKARDVNLLAKDFSSFKQRLTNYAKTYFPNTYNDFSETSVGNMFIELSSYVGDVLSYSIDYNFKESLLSQASEDKNIIRLAQSLGYKVPLSTPAVTSLEVYQLLPNNGLDEPDWSYALRVAPNMIINSEVNSSIQFRTTEAIDFSDMELLDNINDFVSVYAEDGGTVTFYLIKYYKEVSVISGVQRSIEISVGDPLPYYKVELPDSDVMDIISVVDSDGNKYYEVDYLAQDSILIDSELTSATTAPFYQPKIRKVPRRFVTRVNKNLRKEIQFGSGTTEGDEGFAQPLFNIKDADGSNLAIDPVSFATSQTYGKVPSNTTLTIKYTVGNGVQSNVGQNELTSLFQIPYVNDTSGLNSIQRSTLNEIQQTLTVTNPQAASGGKGRLSANEIRENALKLFSSQKRCVTSDDYRARILAMPEKYGSIAKAYVARHKNLNNVTTPNPTIDAFLLSYNSNGQLTSCNNQLKKNLSIYLNQFRMLTDGVNLLDGYVINIGVDFEISVYSSFNKNDVLIKCIDRIKDFFSTDKMQFNQPIYLNDLELTIGSVDGVRTINQLRIKNLVDGNYSPYHYPIQSATRDKIIYPSIEPSVFEIKFPNSDIKGKVK
jgi:hypothetical protein